MWFAHSQATAATSALLFAHFSLGFVLPAKPNTITHFNADEHNLHSSVVNSNFSLVPRQDSAPEWLRIMPLGASITAGQGSLPDSDGYRKPLRDHLRSLGYKVNMVGSQSSGKMNDKQHEGWPGYRIDQVTDKIEASAGTKPNLYLINAGTNDCQQTDRSMDGVIGRLGTLVQKAFDKSEEATVILSTVLPSYNEATKPGARARGVGLNAEIRNLARLLRSSGKRLVLADMDDGYLQESDLNSDGIHPTVDGYRKVAAVWAAAISSARSQKFLQDPENTGLSDSSPSQDNTCDKVPGRADGPHRIQNGYGFDDGPYKHASTKMNLYDHPWYFVNHSLGKDIQKAQYAQVINLQNVGDPKAAVDDLIVWTRESGEIRIDAYANGGAGEVNKHIYTFPAPFNCPSDDVRWADWNGDYLDDYICVDSDARVMVGINLGVVGGQVLPFKSAGYDHPSYGSAQGRQVRLADIDGDGRADYCIIQDDGELHCWRNGGLTDHSEYWQDMGVVFNAIGKKGDEIRLVDINGDGRADWVWVGDQGQTDIYTNLRGPGPGEAKKTLKPYWLRAEKSHAGVGEDGARDFIRFGRILIKDVSGRRDYVYFKPYSLDAEQMNTMVWRNDGAGGTKRRSDANRYGDMTGEGRDDYLQVYSNGDIYMFGNVGTFGQWKDRGIIYNIGPVDRRFVHLADWDGDGFDDIIIVDRATGWLKIHRNTYDGKGGPMSFIPWDTRSDFACSKQGYTIGLFDLAVRFADIDGDGRDDYLCMDQDGRTEAILNTKSGPKRVGQIKASETYDRENHRWADVNGDGRADFLWVEKFTGDTWVWYNKGQRTEADRPSLKGSIFEWSAEGKLYFGQDRGPNQYFMDYDGDGRADLVRVDPNDDTGDVYLNKCPAGTGGDDANMNPSLPAYGGGNTCEALVPVNFCDTIPGYCDDEYYLPEDNYIATGSTRRSALEARGDSDTLSFTKIVTRHGTTLRMIVIFLAYPVWKQLLEKFVSQNYYDFNSSPCKIIPELDLGLPPMTIGHLPTLEEANDPDFILPWGQRHQAAQVEHTIDRQVMLEFFRDITLGILHSKLTTPSLPAIDGEVFQSRIMGIKNQADQDVEDGIFHKLYPGLGLEPPLVPGGAQSAIPMRRVMEPFGTFNNPKVLLFCNPEMNGAKGRIMRGKASSAIEVIKEAAETAASTDTLEAEEALMHHFRLADATWEYMRQAEFIVAFNNVRQGVRTELGRIETHTGIENLVAWWDIWSNDYFAWVETTAISWFYDAARVVRAAVQARVDANQPVPSFMRDIDQKLRDMDAQIQAGKIFRLPYDTSMPNTKKVATEDAKDEAKQVDTDELKNITAGLGDLQIEKPSDAVQVVDVDDLKNITAALGELQVAS